MSTMTVVYAPGEGAPRPMIRIANRWLLESGFMVGSKFDVTYAKDIITIKKLDQKHEHDNCIQNSI